MNQQDKEKFGYWFTALSETCRQPLSAPTIASYLAYFKDKITIEQFVKSAEHLFNHGCEQLPSPLEWVRLARTITTGDELPLPPAPETLAYADMTPDQQEAFKAAIQSARAKFRAEAKPSKSRVFSSIGELIDDIQLQPNQERFGEES